VKKVISGTSGFDIYSSACTSCRLHKVPARLSLVNVAGRIPRSTGLRGILHNSVDFGSSPSAAHRQIENIPSATTPGADHPSQHPLGEVGDVDIKALAGTSSSASIPTSDRKAVDQIFATTSSRSRR